MIKRDIICNINIKRRWFLIPLRTDPIEETAEYKTAIRQINQKLSAYAEELERGSRGFGNNRAFWNKKKELLAECGVDWKTPKEMNKGVHFD